jgi:tRNA(Ile)-lysidine synthase
VILTADRLLDALGRLPKAACCHLALSGGLDSCVLLHLLVSLGERLPWPLQAIHVHHGLQADADRWQAHCEALCAYHGIPLHSARLALAPAPGESLEACARQARYRVFAAQMARGELLLTAQHRDDQAETLLLQLLRGSGPAGLAAMPALSRFGPGWLARPLLDFPRESLEHYAREHHLSWQEDPSNRDLRFDRNFIRHAVMPLLASRWPAASATLARAARFSGELLSLAKAEAEADLSRVRQADGEGLSVTALRGFDSIRLRNLLRHWIAATGAPLPHAKKLERIEREAVFGRDDAMPLVVWRGWEVRRYRDRLTLGRALPAADGRLSLEWIDRTKLILPDGMGRLVVDTGEGGIDPARWAAARIEVRFRRGGERCRPAGQVHHRPLKKLFQEWGIPPWQRARVPLIYLDGELAAIPGRLVCQPFAAADTQASILVRWEFPDRADV